MERTTGAPTARSARVGGWKQLFSMLLVLATAVAQAGCGSAVRSGNYFDTTHARDVQVGHDRAQILAWFGQAPAVEPLAQDGSGCVERWTYAYGAQDQNAWTGMAGGAIHAYALIVDFDASGRVCRSDYQER